MKKLATRTLAVLMTMACILSFAACGQSASAAPAVSELGTYTSASCTFLTITQGKLGTGFTNVLTIFSDNTFILTQTLRSFYSSDNGESYVPLTATCEDGVYYGEYELIDENKDLNEKTIKITSISKVLSSGVEVEDINAEENWFTSDLTGEEIILASDNHIEQVYGQQEYLDFMAARLK